MILKKFIMKQLSLFKHCSFITCILLFTSACGTMTVLDIPESDVPVGLWEGDSEIYVSNFQLSDPSIENKRKSGDCPSRVASRPTGPASRAYCAETRTYDSSRSCNVVSSTFGAGYCPSDYSNQNSANAQSMREIDAIRSAGTAAQNAVLAWGQNMSLQAQKTALEITQKYKLSSEMGSAVSEENNIEVNETLIVSSFKGYSAADLIARTREGYYAECIIPHFSKVGKLSTSYYRVQADQLACELKKGKKGFTPTYINMRTDSKQKTSFIGSLRAKEKNDAYEICMLDPMMSLCSYKIQDLLVPEDFEYLRGFVELNKPIRSSITLDKIDTDLITVKLIINDEDGVGTLNAINVPFDGNSHDVGGLKMRIDELNIDSVKLIIEGSFNLE